MESRSDQNQTNSSRPSGNELVLRPVSHESKMAPSGGDSVSTSSTTNLQEPSKETDYKLYSRRWYILIVIVILNLSNAMIWITFSPIADITSSYYRIDSFKVNVLSLVYMIASIPFGFVASWVLDTFGLRSSILLSAWLNGIGSLLRNVSTFSGISQDARYPILVLGQTLAACSQPFVMFAPTKLAALWFPENQRATANMLASMANPLGILGANLVAPAIVNGCSDTELPLALWVITAPCLLVMVMATFGICSSVPPTPPTASAGEKSETFKDGLKKLARNKNYWVLNITFGTGLAIFSCLTSFLDQILCPRGYSNDFAGLCGALMIAGGVVGAFISGLYVDRTKKFEEVVKVSLGLAVLFGIGFSEVARFRNQEILIATSIGIFGVFGFALYPISMELAVEITYPVAEATSSGLLIVSGQVQGIIILLTTQLMTQPLSKAELTHATCSTGCTSVHQNDFDPRDWTIPNFYINGLGALAACVLIWFLKGDYKRMKAEKKLKAEAILESASTSHVAA